MPAFQVVPAGGSAVDQCDARGPHLLVFGPDDSADGLKSLAPMIFTGSPVVSDYGQFGSLVFDSLARLSMAGAPTKTLASHRCSDTAMHRIWATALLYRSWPGGSRASGSSSSRVSGGSSSPGCAAYVPTPALLSLPTSRSPMRTSSLFQETTVFLLGAP